MRLWFVLFALISVVFSQDLYSEFVKEQVKQIPLSKAIVFGKGKVEIITFINPDCGHCRKEWQDLKKHPDKIKVYIFLLPFANLPESRAKSDYIACSKDRIKALDEVLSGRMDGKSLDVKKCGLVDEHIEIAKTLNINATPYNIILKDYKVIEGYNPRMLEIIGVKK
ncbi:DsbC family protein [Thermocrinis sp.]|uniref:DsbC family protein n=1 Tax=Thermocrinis sp. TaxID=2024383 RepID=UPI002FDD4590